MLFFHRNSWKTDGDTLRMPFLPEINVKISLKNFNPAGVVEVGLAFASPQEAKPKFGCYPHQNLSSWVPEIHD